MAHAGLKEWPLAERTLNQAISLIDGHPELDKLRHNVQHELGIVLRDSGTGKTHEAGHLLRQAAARARRYADYPSLATVLNTLATLYLRHREIPKAKAALKDALEALRRSGDRFREAAILNNLGLAEMEQRNWEASSKHFAQALDIETNAGHIHGQAVCLNNLGRAYRNLGQMQDAQVAATKASELFARVADPFNAAVAQRNLARIYRRSGNIEAARVAFQVAAGWFRAATAIGELETTEQEAARLGLKDGIPWWVWLSAVILISILVAALLAAFLRRGIV